MNVGDKLKINNKEYEVLKIYPDKRFKEKDLILCVNKYGSKECFHRFDLEETPVQYIAKIVKLEPELEEKIVKLLKAGNRPSEVIDMLWYEGVTSRVDTKEEFAVKVRSIANRYKIRFYKRSKPVEQLDDKGNVIARFNSIEEASNVLNVDRETISQVCNGVYLGRKHRFRFGGTDE